MNRQSIAAFILLALVTSAQVHAEPPIVGVGLSKYAYREPSLGVANDGWLGIAQAKWAPDNLRIKNWPLTLSGQATFGYADYTGSGTMANQPTSIYQLQMESPHTEWIKGYQISPDVWVIAICITMRAEPL